MSTFTYETVRLTQDGEMLYAAAYFLSTLVGCAVMFLVGMLLIRGIIRFL